MRLSVFLGLICCALAGYSVAEEKTVKSVAVTSIDVPATDASDIPKQLQAKAIEDGKAAFGYWGTEPDKYTGWTSHSNRLIPVYTFGSRGCGDGVDLDSYTGSKSVYRSEAKVQALYGYVPEKTVNSNAVWMDQTNVADMQRAAAAAGKKYIFQDIQWRCER